MSNTQPVQTQITFDDFADVAGITIKTGADAAGPRLDVEIAGLGELEAVSILEIITAELKFFLEDSE